MKSKLALLLAVPLLLGGLTACGGSSDSGTTEPTTAVTEAQSAEPTTEATEATDSGSAVDAYCQKVDEYAAQMKQYLADPTSVNAEDLQATAQELQDTATELMQELMDDPSKAEQVQQCTTKLQEVLTEAG